MWDRLALQAEMKFHFIYLYRKKKSLRVLFLQWSVGKKPFSDWREVFTSFSHIPRSEAFAWIKLNYHFFLCSTFKRHFFSSRPLRLIRLTSQLFLETKKLIFLFSMEKVPDCCTTENYIAKKLQWNILLKMFKISSYLGTNIRSFQNFSKGLLQLRWSLMLQKWRRRDAPSWCLSRRAAGVSRWPHLRRNVQQNAVIYSLLLFM